MLKVVDSLVFDTKLFDKSSFIFPTNKLCTANKKFTLIIKIFFCEKWLKSMGPKHGFSEPTLNLIEGLREKRQSMLRPLNLSYVSDQIDRKLTQIIHEKARLLIKIQNFMTLSDHKKGLVYVSN